MDINYLKARAELWAFKQRRLHGDDRGEAAQTIVITGISILGAGVVAAILWATLKAGARGIPPVQVTSP